MCCHSSKETEGQFANGLKIYQKDNEAMIPASMVAEFTMAMNKRERGEKLL
jgi:hypothetical protein